MISKFPAISLIILGLLSATCFTPAYSQSKDIQKPLTEVIYNTNVDAALTSNELLQIQEVYGDTANENVLDLPQRVKDIKNILRNRVQIVDAGSKDLSPLKKLSSVELFSEYQPNVTRDFNFNPKTFNPLKYKFNFYSRNSAIYHVDNTSFYIVIKSQFD